MKVMILKAFWLFVVGLMVGGASVLVEDVDLATGLLTCTPPEERGCLLPWRGIMIDYRTFIDITDECFIKVVEEIVRFHILT